jgi:single-stranded DNA-binding protein
MFQGNLTVDPQLRHTAGGTAVAEFRVLVNHRLKDGDEWIDGEPTGTTSRSTDDSPRRWSSSCGRAAA